MIGITDLMVFQEEYISYVFENTDWDKFELFGGCSTDDKDGYMDYFLFQATNNWIEGEFDFADFIEKNYNINNIEDVITGKTVCDLIQIVYSYHMDECGECHINFGNLTVKDMIRHWAYVHSHLNRDEINIFEEDDEE